MGIQGEINKNTAIVGGFNTPLTSMNRSSRKKINKETATLNNIVDQIDLIDISRTLPSKTADIYTFQVHMECFLG